MEPIVNAGSGWTVLSTECWLSSGCSECVYSRYCYPNGPGVKPLIKLVIDKLYTQHGEPPEKLIIAAVSELNVL